MNVRTVALALFLAAGLAACAGTSTWMVGEARAPVAPESVRIYHSRPPGAIDIAELESTSAIGFGTQGQREAALARLRREAGELGANGILVLGGGRSDSGVGMSVGAGSYGSHGGAAVSTGIPTTQEHAHGMAIWVPPGAAESTLQPAVVEPAVEPAAQADEPTSPPAEH